MKAQINFSSDRDPELLPSTDSSGPATDFSGPAIASDHAKSVILQTGNERHQLPIRQGFIPRAPKGAGSLDQMCSDLKRIISETAPPYTALQFVPAIEKLRYFDPSKMGRLAKDRHSSYILIQNEWLKAVLIHWRPGKRSKIHGHPHGGCLFKVLKGALEEKRYSPDQSHRLLATTTLRAGTMAYIDDQLAYHAVSNPFKTAAISLHVYAPGE